jgi:hypothetical protein
MMVGPGWNAGVVRARLLARRRLGPEGCRQLARSASLDEALERLASGPYAHDLSPGQDLTTARRAVAATALWDLRVLGGWLPPAGAELIRAFVGWWEVLNIEGKVAELSGGARRVPFDLGRLDTAWDRVKASGSLAAVRTELEASRWSAPGSDVPGSISTWLRLSWAQRTADEARDLQRLLAAWAALVVARSLAEGAGADVEAPTVPVLGRAWRDARSLPELRARVPRSAGWVLAEVEVPSDLWRAEAHWWRAFHDEGRQLLRLPSSGAAAVAGAFALLLSDVHAVQGAMEIAAWEGADKEIVDETL